MAQSLYIFGASGHGKVIHSVAKALGYSVLGFVDDDPSKTVFDGVPVVKLERLPSGSNVFVAIGNAQSREHVTDKLLSLGIKLPNLVHPQAIVDDSAELGHGTVVMAGAIVAAGCKLGNGVIINHGSVLDHDGVVGDFCHVCPGVSIAGAVKIGRGSWIGIGSTIIQETVVGSNVTIGAGTVVIRNLGDNIKVVGVPARQI